MTSGTHFHLQMSTSSSVVAPDCSIQSFLEYLCAVFPFFLLFFFFLFLHKTIHLADYVTFDTLKCKGKLALCML
jgi:hypothetical protein